jgi:hypothetical protein
VITTPKTAAGEASGRRTQHVERKADVVGGKINRADTIGLSDTAREEIASLATTRKLAARSRPPQLPQYQ